MHPLVEMAKKQFFLNSHQDIKMILPENKESIDFYNGAEELIRNIDEYPHALLLASLMDTNVDVNVAWTIPYRIFLACGSFDINYLYNIPFEQYIEWFNGDHKWHRHPEKKAKVFYDAVHKIVEDDYIKSNVSKIWEGKPSSLKVITKLLEFNGCGFKIANMIPNLLLRYYGIELMDYQNIDIAPDIHTVRVFSRLGLTPEVQNEEASKIYTIVKARDLNKEFPGVVDGLCWEVGRNYCRPSNPNCIKCLLRIFCEYRNKKESQESEIIVLKDTSSNLGKNNKTDISLETMKDEFSQFQRVKERKEDRIMEDRSWAFAHYGRYIGINFWDSLRDEEGIAKCRKCFEEVALNGGFSGKGVKDPKSYAVTYITSIKRLKGFLDEAYGGVDHYLALKSGIN